MKKQCLMASALSLCIACMPALPPPPPPSAPATRGDDHLLYQPTADASGLLGLAVTRGPDGVWVLADERAPGCHVTEREVTSVWKRDFEEDIGNLAFAGASVSTLAELKLEYGNQILTRSTIENVRVLTADLSGPCGEQVIKSVKIGSGKRELMYRQASNAGARAGVVGVGAGAGAEGWQRSRERLEWQDPQAWAFTVSSMGLGQNVRLGIDMPTELTDGEEYRIELSSPQEVWIIALYEEADGRAGILLPNRESPTVVVSAGQRHPLPVMQVGLRNPTAEAREKIVIVAFTAREDYEDFRPPAGAVSEAEATAYHRALPERLSKLPRKRWGRGEMSYVIKPKGKP